MNRHPFIELRNVSKFFGGVCATDKVSLTIRPGEIIGLVGDNAAGKSTLSKIISGVHRPSCGELLVDGNPVTFRSPRDAREAGIEMVFQIQDAAMVPDLDVAENLFLGKELYKKVLGVEVKWLLDRKTMRVRTREFLDDLMIHIHSVTQKMRFLSGGQQQSVAIARAVFFDARLVILDEPTSAISVKETQKVLDLICQLRDKGVSVIIISHRMDDIFATSDRIVVLRHGQKIEDIPRAETTVDAIVKKIVHAENEALQS
jgi:simple sugar transport system ATP-binding protein